MAKASQKQEAPKETTQEAQKETQKETQPEAHKEAQVADAKPAQTDESKPNTVNNINKPEGKVKTVEGRKAIEQKLGNGITRRDFVHG